MPRGLWSDTVKGIYSDARREGFSVDPHTGAVSPLYPDRATSDLVYLIEQQDLEARIAKVLVAANAADADLADALRTAGSESTGPSEDRPDIRGQLSHPPDDPTQFHDFWDKLSPQERDWLYQQNHSIGTHDGMPIVDRDKMNRQHLRELTSGAQADVDRLRAQHPDWAAGQPPSRTAGQAYGQWKTQGDNAQHTLQGYQQVGSALQAPRDANGNPKDNLPRFLDSVDDKGHGAVSINNPDTAIRNATYVPGTGQDPPRRVRCGGSPKKVGRDTVTFTVSSCPDIMMRESRALQLHRVRLDERKLADSKNARPCPGVLDVDQLPMAQFVQLQTKDRFEYVKTFEEEHTRRGRYAGCSAIGDRGSGNARQLSRRRLADDPAHAAGGADDVHQHQ